GVSGKLKQPRVNLCYYTTPWSSIASATLTKPAMFAPTTRLPGWPYSSAVSQEFLKIVDMMWRKRESTSSRGHGKRIEFWLISRPDVATPPAFAALPGPNRIFFSMKRSTAAGTLGMLAASDTRYQPLLTSLFASSAVISFSVAHGKAQSHFMPQGRSPATYLEPRNFLAYSLMRPRRTFLMLMTKASFSSVMPFLS